MYPDRGGQIADGEPEIAFYAGRLNGRNGPLVTSYWSVLDQAFIIPDGMSRGYLSPDLERHKLDREMYLDAGRILV